MKKIVSIIIFLSIGFTSSAQVAFNKVYDKSNTQNGGFQIIEISDGGYLIAASYSGSGTGGVWIIKLTTSGDTVWTKKYNLSAGLDKAYDLLELSSGEFILCGVTQDTLGVYVDGYLMQINTIGDSLWLKRYGGIDPDLAYNLVQTPDGGFVVSGWKLIAPSFSESDAWVFKTDSLGNMLWEKQFDNYGLDDVFEKVIITPDGNIVCAGTTVLNSVNGKDYVVKLNQQGDTIWTQQFGGIECGGTFDINSTADGGFIGCGGICINGEQRARAYRLDSLGSLIWAKDFARGDRNYSFSAIHELPNGNFMAAGVDIDVNQPILTGEPRVRLFEMNTLGDSLWSKQYTHYGNGSEDYLFDMKLTNDGGYIMCGYIINSSLPQKNDVLVIKVDSNGCDVSNCTVGINENTLIENEVIVYPNPNNGTFTIEASNLENSVLEIYNLTGQLVNQTTLNKNTTVIDINNQAKGLYLLKISNNKQLITKRIVKQ
ncbi:MAG: hypothetical protein COA97_01400 [Flavobacteriales bacterium]|nr:MAG: hypothetical protein COA97_01400 [Flavobacteriales bacterium]